jgi:TRAP transporter TAXI family solute receptor
MAMRRYLVASMILITLILGTLSFKTACASSPREPYEITIYTLSVGSTNYLFGVALAELINKHSSWLRARAVEGMNPESHQKMLALEPEKRKNMLVFSSPLAQWRIETGRVQGVKPYFGHRQVACWGIAANAFISLNSKITKLEDLKGKKVGVDLKRFSGRCELPLAVVKQYVPLDEIRIEYLSPIDGFDALRNGLLDVYYAIGVMKSLDIATPSAATQEFLDTVRQKPYFLSPSPDKVEAASKDLGGFQMSTIAVAPRTFHPKQEVPWVLSYECLTWGADAAMPEDVAYEIAKIHLDHHKRFMEAHPSGTFISRETIGLMGVHEELVHPGALNFYKKEGVKIGAVGGKTIPKWR